MHYAPVYFTPSAARPRHPNRTPLSKEPTMNTTATKPNTNGTASTAQAFNQQATDTVKTNMEAGQKMFNTFADTFTKGWNMNAFATPAVTMPAMFEKMTKVMNSMVEANAKLVTEMSTIAVESMKNNAKSMERTGEMMVAQMTSKSVKPMTEVAREIYDETVAFNNKTVERMNKVGTEHGQRVAQIMDETMTCKTGCCNN
jgi:hypothetical protein